MNFLRLSDPLLTVLFEDEDIIAFNKPYGFNTHTNDSKIDHSEFIEDGLIEMLEKQRLQRLHIIHRLDQTTTGVIIFGKSVDSAKKYAEFFFHRQVQKTYWFITAAKSSRESFHIDQIIIHKGKELEADTEFALLKKANNYELWQAKPHTGRNHQIRIHSQAAGISILGDPKYGGKDYAFLCLHNRRIQFPNGIVIEASPPVYFEQPELLNDLILAKAFFEADRRLRLYAHTDLDGQCFRLVHSKTSSSKSNLKENEFSIDQFGRYLILTTNKEALNEFELKRFSQFSAFMEKPMLVRGPKGSTTMIPSGTEKIPQAWEAREGDISYELRTDAAGTVGISPQLRIQRHWLRTNSAQKKVLVLFAQTGGFPLSAAIGGASEVVLVESSKNLLNWSRRNFELNAAILKAKNIPNDALKFLCRESIAFLKQCVSKQTKFDIIVCDAPSFLRLEKGIFKIENELEAIVLGCLQSLTADGKLLFSTTSENLFIEDIKKAVSKVQKQLQIRFLKLSSIQAALDLELPYEKTNLKSFLIELGEKA